MRWFVRCWDTMGRAERIVAMSLATGSVVAMVNSTAWAIAVCYMARQKALVALADQRGPVERNGEHRDASTTPPVTTADPPVTSLRPRADALPAAR